MDTRKRKSIEIFRDRVATLIKENEMTQETFAEHCGLLKTDISNLSRKQAVPDDVMLAIADKCNVSTDWLLGRTDIREMARSKEESEKDFDYSKVTYGDLNRMLAFAAACGVLQIVPPENNSDNVSLLVRNETTSEFLRRLQKKAIDVITDSDEAEYLTDWLEKKCTNNERLAFWFDGILGTDKYHGSFPWEYSSAIGEDLEFNFKHATWVKDNPEQEWNNAWFEYLNNCGILHGPYHGVDKSYSNYINLFDGFTGYYNFEGDVVDAPEPPHLKKTDQQSTVNGFMNIPDGTDEELPFN